MNPPILTQPAATFIVERVPGEGYKVTTDSGPRAKEWLQRAETLIGSLGQPDPQGTEPTHRLLGPLSPSGEYVSVVIRRTSIGESRYEQAWYEALDVPKPTGRSFRTIGTSLAIGLILGTLIGGSANYLSRVSARNANVFTAANEPQQPVDDGPPNAPAPLQRPWVDPVVTRLKDDLRNSRSVRQKITAYLSQEGLSADKSEVIQPKRSIKVVSIAEIDPKQLNMELSTLEVAELLKVLRLLDEISLVTSSKP